MRTVATQTKGEFTLGEYSAKTVHSAEYYIALC